MLRIFVEKFLTRLTAFQAARPILVLAIAILTAVPSWLLARNLELRTGFGELLPDNRPSVIEQRRASKRLASVSTLAVTAESKNTALLKRFMDELAPKLRKLPPDLVSGVEDGPRELQQFFRENKHLYASLEEIESLHDDVIARYDWEVGRQMGTNIDDEEPSEINADTLEKRFKRSVDQAKKTAPGIDGYYIGEDGKFAVILVRTPLGSMSQRAFDLQKQISELIEAGNYKQVDPNFRYGFTGNLITSAEEYRSVTQDLTSIGTAGVSLVLLVVFLFFLRVRVLIALGVTIGVGCLWCFAFTELAIGHLNTATGFLVSVIAGNGINTMIIYMARYLEARRDQQLEMLPSLRTASIDTCGATFAAVGVAMVSYGALMTTDFRGFRHFGIIGAAGMFLCWVATYTVLPAVLVLCERLRPFKATRGWRDRLSGLYGRPFIYIAKRWPKTFAAVGVITGVLGLIGTTLYFTSDPMEYNLKAIRNDPGPPTSARGLGSRVNKIVGTLNQNGRAVLVDRLDQVEPLINELERRREAAPEAKKPFGQVVSVYSLLPKDQPKKLELLSEIKDRLDRARKRGFISDEDWKKLEPELPKTLAAIDMNDLPELIARPFQEKDGTRGKIVYVAPAPGESINDLHYLLRWAEGFREVRLPNGEVIYGTGDPVVFSDMLLNIVEDAPRVTLLSFLGTMFVILLAFRGRPGGWVALATLGLGLSWMMGILYAGDVKLNFLNFLALPIAIGVGSDYAINVMKRREIEGDAGIELAFTETGGAVVACSMTTLSGYIALLFSINGAVRSLGLTAALGELTTQFSAMLILPAMLYFVSHIRSERAKKRAASSPEQGTGADLAK